jgi:hypothetical protein
MFGWCPEVEKVSEFKVFWVPEAPMEARNILVGMGEVNEDATIVERDAPVLRPQSS